MLDSVLRHALDKGMLPECAGAGRRDSQSTKSEAPVGTSECCCRCRSRADRSSLPVRSQSPCLGSGLCKVASRGLEIDVSISGSV